MKGSQERIHFPSKTEMPKGGTPAAAVEILLGSRHLPQIHLVILLQPSNLLR